MPKLKYRFRVTFAGFGAGSETYELTKQVMNVTRPDITFAEVPIHVYNSTIKLIGKHSFADAKLVLRDDTSGVVSKIVGAQMQKQFDFFEQASAASGIDYKFVMYVEILDGNNGATEPTTLETFEFLGCYVKQATYSNVDYAVNDPVQIDLSIGYDNVLQSKTPNDSSPSGLGSAVGRTIGALATGGSAGTQ
jgi:hypothetical protein